MHVQNLHGELRTGRKQQDQNGTSQHGASITNSATAADISRVAMWLPLFWAKRSWPTFAPALGNNTQATDPLLERMLHPLSAGTIAHMEPGHKSVLRKTTTEDSNSSTSLCYNNRATFLSQTGSANDDS
jgi:hypothetical protein